MTKLVFGIFAHPDDEAFGPSGVLLQEARSGAEVHLVLLTAGDAGRNPDNVPDLASTRLDEWRTSGELIGASGQHFLGYKDGALNNKHLEAIGHQLIEIITRVANQSVTEIELISSDLNGITGHIDHIVAARAATFAFYRLKSADARPTKLKLACVPRERRPEANTEWIFAEAGRTPEEIDEIVDVRKLQDEIIAIMKTHHSQREDCAAHLENRATSIGVYHFLTKE